MINRPLKDKPQSRSDRGSMKQTDEPWKGVPEKEQFDPAREKPDLEKWNKTNTH